MKVLSTSKFKERFFEWLPENNRLELIWKLGKIDFDSRYYEQRLGVLWALIKPLTELFIYYFIFSVIFANDVPYFGFYIFAGLIFWSFFIEGINKGIVVLQQKKYLLEAISFNKIDLFLSTNLSATFAFIFNLAVFFVIAILFGINIFNITLLWFPLIFLNFFLMILGMSLILATLRIYFNDIQHLWDMMMLGGFWVTPLVYDYKLMLENAPWVLYANPISGIIVNFRETVLYGRPILMDLFLLDWAYAIFFLVLGLVLFNRFSFNAAEKL